MNGQPWGIFRPGSPPGGYGFTHNAASWWTPGHVIHVILAVLLVLVIVALAAALVWDALIRPPRGQVTVREWFRLPRWERDHRVAEFKAADEALQINSYEEHQAGVTEETETYHVLNSRVHELRGTVPWWCRQ